MPAKDWMKTQAESDLLGSFQVRSFRALVPSLRRPRLYNLDTFVNWDCARSQAPVPG
jgi:hypothetical protein